MCNLPTDIKIAYTHQITADLDRALFKASKGAFSKENASAVSSALTQAIIFFPGWPKKDTATQVAQQICAGKIEAGAFKKSMILVADELYISDQRLAKGKADVSHCKPFLFG